MKLLTPEEEDQVLQEAPVDFLSFYRWSNPTYGLTPRHMPELLKAMRSTLDEPFQGTFSAPPQFGKSLLVLTGLCWYGYLRPGTVSAYVSYSDDIALAQSDHCWKIAEAAGLKPTGTKSRIEFANGSVILFTSIGGALEGKAVTGWLVFDDPYKNLSEAQSAEIRANVEEWFFGTALGRGHMTTSIFVIGHRWVPEDLIALLKSQGWSHVNYEAIITDVVTGAQRSFWEELKSLVWLLKLKGKTLPSVWEGEYQGNPSPTGMRVFEGAYRYTKLPETYEVAIGFDGATTAKSSADWSAIVVMAAYFDMTYILWAGRWQLTAPEVLKKALLTQSRWPGAMWRWYVATSEKGAGQFMQSGGLELQVKIAAADKKIRATPYAAAWFHKKVLVPDVTVPELAHHAEWLIPFLAEHRIFTGVNDLHDDFIDAGAAAFDILPHDALPEPKKLMSPHEKRLRMLEMSEEADERAFARTGPDEDWEGISAE